MKKKVVGGQHFFPLVLLPLALNLVSRPGKPFRPGVPGFFVLHANNLIQLHIHRVSVGHLISGKRPDGLCVTRTNAAVLTFTAAFPFGTLALAFMRIRRIAGAAAAGWALAHILQLTLPFLALTAPIGTLPFQDVDAVVGFANDPLDVLERGAFRRPLCWLGVDIRLKVSCLWGVGWRRGKGVNGSSLRLAGRRSHVEDKHYLTCTVGDVDAIQVLKVDNVSMVRIFPQMSIWVHI